MDKNRVRKKLKGSDRSENWAHLIPELLELIFKRLILSDQVRCSSVCKSWFFFAKKKLCPPALELPWLMLRNLKHYYEFFSLTENRVFKVDKKAIYRGMVRGSSQGWLVTEFVVGTRFCLLNPFSKVKILLPHHLTLPYLKHPLYISVFRKALDNRSYKRIGDIERAIVFSCGQCGNNNLKSTIVAVLSVFGFLSFCKVGEYAWRAPQYWWRTYDDVLFYNGNLYAVERAGLIDVLRLDDVLSFPLMHTYSFPRTENSSMYLVESCGDLLMVKRCYQSSEGPTNGFVVHKLELKVQTSPQCIKMNSLGDQVLFLGTNSSLSFAAEKFSEFKPNHIYFTGNDFNGSGDFGAFSMEDGSIRPFPSPLCNLQLVSPIWVTPIPVLKM